MTTFSNSANTKLASSSSNHTYQGNAYDTKWCRERCIELAAKGINAFYKKAIENGEVKYYVYSF
ncbi:hypothetical protein SAMN04515674_105334 [Pseudarcicella hirudinis]|uniref:Uncharacterized protein n=1 Tax=Pseudarcicella hirudinis TaxID=1079859 RepID=A0A1I5T243_9BACT|nr:hypothetical protein [Pseudarcicella hirudinis]SFP77099.1 hypothetical protein SAMN04515674_105334 [Pseudarcicella hirudinis]